MKPVSTIYTRVGCLSEIFYFILIYFINSLTFNLLLLYLTFISLIFFLF